jgi:hypothetical protein
LDKISLDISAISHLKDCRVNNFDENKQNANIFSSIAFSKQKIKGNFSD